MPLVFENHKAPNTAKVVFAFSKERYLMENIKRVDVSICIVNWNTKELLRNCIKSIYEKTEGLIFEVIIVDNASIDGSVEMLKSVFPQCKIIASTVNLGFSKGNNLAVKNSYGRYILFLNPDTELKTNAIYGMFKFLEDNPGYGAVGCKLLSEDNSIQFTCARRLLTPFREFCFLAMLDRIFPKSEFFGNTDMNYWDHSNSRDVDCLSGACIMTRTQVIDQIGAFNENYFMYGDDIDLCYRIIKSGRPIYYLANEEIYHFSGASSSQRVEKFFSSIVAEESHYKFMKDNFGTMQAVNFRIAVSSGSIIRLVASALLYSISMIFKQRSINVSIYSIKKYWYIFLWSIKINQGTIKCFLA